MSLGKVARKLKRVGKTASQFRFTSTFEYVELSFNGSWRPDNLRVVWLRNHRKVKSTEVQWVPTEDRGPNGADGKAVFDPPIAVALIVTLYKENDKMDFQEKEYKYYIENYGANGKKVLASFHCDISEYAGVPSSNHTLAMTFKPVSVKVNKAVLGITLQSEFVKQGSAADDDMQSTFSAMSAGTDTSLKDESDEEEDIDSAQLVHKLSVVQENEEGRRAGVEDSLKSVLVLGTGETLKRNKLPVDAPPKPDRSKHHEDMSASTNGLLQDTTQEQTDHPPSDKESREPPCQKEGDHPPTNKEADHPSTCEASADEKLLTNGIEEGETDKKDQVLAKADEKGRESCSKNGRTEEFKENKKPESEISRSVDSPKQNTSCQSGTGVENGSSTQSTEQANTQCQDTCTKSTQQQQEEECISHTDKEKQVKNSETIASNGDSLIESVEPKHKPQESETPGVSYGGAHDYVFEAARSLAELRKSSEAGRTQDSVLARKELQSQDEYKPPPNPFLEEEDGGSEWSEEPPSPTLAWVGEDAMFIDCFGETVSREKLDRAEFIALYFSASWCPPCRRFLPKLVKFYHHLKQHGKSFEVLYISSDYSKQEMMKYMQQQQMPWVGLSFDGNIGQALQKMFNVSAIPQLKIVTTRGELIEESAKKPVEVTNSGSDVLKLYNKWHDKLDKMSDDGKDKGLFQKVKKAIKRRGTDSENLDSSSSSHSTPLSRSKEDMLGRQVVEIRPARLRTSKGRAKDVDTLVEEKEERIRNLEEINMTLKHTNDELTEEVADLKRQLSMLQVKMDEVEQTSKQLERDKRETEAQLGTRGWLFKRGVKGPTANVWRRRYFRCDQGSKICYYKTATEGTPQGFIDLAKLISVQEVSPAQQDKNNATFLVQCDGRTYQLQAIDEATMRKWMTAIEYLARWHKSNSLQNGARP